MNEEERRRKIILDNLEALAHATGCMRWTMLITGRSKLTDEQVDEFKSTSDKLAKMAADIEKGCR